MSHPISLLFHTNSKSVYRSPQKKCVLNVFKIMKVEIPMSRLGYILAAITVNKIIEISQI